MLFLFTVIIVCSYYCENLHDCQLITLVLCLIVNESNNIERSSNYSNFVNKGGGGLRFRGEGYSKLQKEAYSEHSLISKTNVFSKTVKVGSSILDVQLGSEYASKTPL